MKKPGVLWCPLSFPFCMSLDIAVLLASENTWLCDASVPTVNVELPGGPGLDAEEQLCSALIERFMALEFSKNHTKSWEMCCLLIVLRPPPAHSPWAAPAAVSGTTSNRRCLVPQLSAIQRGKRVRCRHSAPHLTAITRLTPELFWEMVFIHSTAALPSRKSKALAFSPALCVLCPSQAPKQIRPTPIS